LTRNVLSACCTLGSNLGYCDWPMAQCSYGGSVVTSDLSAGYCNCNQKCPIPMQHLPGIPRRLRHLTSPTLPSLPRPGHNFHKPTHSPNHIPRCTTRMCAPICISQWHCSNLRALAGRHLPFADTDRRRNQAPPTVGCNLWLLPVASWSSTIPLVHCSPRPRLCPYPRACCCFLPALPCSPRFLRCWPLSRAGNAREKAQSLF
jgi:hypothetical protein